MGTILVEGNSPPIKNWNSVTLFDRKFGLDGFRESLVGNTFGHSFRREAKIPVLVGKHVHIIFYKNNVLIKLAWRGIKYFKINSTMSYTF